MSKNTIDLTQLDAKKARNTKSADAYFGKGITLAAGFDLGAKSALDSRSTVKTMAERDAHVTGNRAYEGMTVYVEENQKTYQLVNGEWKIFGLDSEILDAAKTEVEDNLESTRTDAALSANQGKVLKEMIDAQSEMLTEQSEKLDTIEGKLDQAIEDIAGLGTDLEEQIGDLDDRLTTVEGDMATAKEDISNAQTDIADLKSDVAEIQTDITAVEEAIAAEAERAEQAEQALDAKIDAAVKELEDADGELRTSINELDAKVDSTKTELEEKITAEETAREEAVADLQSKIDANTAAINKEVQDRTDEIARVEGLLTNANQEISEQIENLGKEVTDLKAKDAELEQAIEDETTAREEADAQLRTDLEGVTSRVDKLEEDLAGIELTWDKVTDKPFDTLGQTLKVTDGQVDVKVDGVTIAPKADGTLEVVDGVFSKADHNHDDAYASKDHELNQEIHLTAEEKVNVGKIPTIETDVNLLKQTVGAASTHIIVETLAELPGLIDSCNHATIAHVVETNETYILEKSEDINGNQVTPEWIKLSDSNALVSVDWSVINNKPFSSIAEGLIVDGDALKVATDDTTLEIVDGKVKVKDDVFAEKEHTHVVDFADVVNKPVAFTNNYSAANFIDGVGEDAGLCYLIVDHNKNSKNLKVTVIGNDGLERFVGIGYDSENTITIWSDEKESVTVIVNSLDFVTTTVNMPAGVQVGTAKVGTVKVGK